MKYAHGVVVGGLVLGLAGCGASLNAPTLYGGAAMPQGLVPRTGLQTGGCGGSGGVRVRPCPVTLTKRRSTVDVTVRGPNVVDSAIKTNKKNHSGCGDICELGQLSSKPLEYYVSAGTKCGTAGLSFYGYNQSGATVGIGKLKVINKDC